MIAKLIGWGRTRAEALARLRCAVDETTVVIDGGTTDQAFLRALLARPEVRDGTVDTTWVDRISVSGGIEAGDHADVALVVAAIEACDAAIAADRAQFLALARRGRPHADLARGRSVDVRHGGSAYRLLVRQVAPERYRVSADGATVEAAIERHGAHERRVAIGERSWRVVVSSQGSDLLVEVDGVPHRVLRDDGGVVRSLAPAVVVALPVAEGDTVEAGDVVAVVESMKMETSLTAPFASRVRRVLVAPNVQVRAHEPLLQLDPTADGVAAETGGERVRLRAGDAPDEAAGAPLAAAERLVLGYDVEPAEAMASVRAAHAGPVTEELLAAEERLLAIHADISSLTRARSDADLDVPGELVGSPHEDLHAWLRELDPAQEGLPAPFLVTLDRALRHYGIEEPRAPPAAGGGGPPAVSGLRAHRRRPRDRARDPRPPPRAAAVPGRRRLPRRARPPRDRRRRPRPGARRPGPRGAPRLLRRPGHRGRA